MELCAIFRLGIVVVRRLYPLLRPLLARVERRRPMSGPTNSLRLDAQLCFAVYSAAHAFNRAYKPLLQALDLTYPQYLVMLALWEEDGQPLRRLGERLLLDSGTLTPLLKRLETAQLITRTRNPDDERQLRVSLTRKGQELKERAAQIPAALGCAIGWPEGEIERLKRELIEVRDSLNGKTANAS